MVSHVTRPTVRVYASLAALGGESTDILQRLIPFFEPILEPAQGKILDLDDFVEKVRGAYGWNLNRDVVEVFIPRLVEAGWLIPNKPDLQMTRYTVVCPDQNQDIEIETSAQNELNAIAESFKLFAKDLKPLNSSINFLNDVEYFEEILIEWLLYVEAFSQNNIEFSESSNLNNSGNMNANNFPKATKLNEEEIFICARFVEHSIKNDPLVSEKLARIAAIGLLTEVIQDFVKPVTPVEKSDLTIFLDAPVAMEFLGVSGKAAKANTTPIIKELKRIGVSVSIFKQSIDEIMQNLKGVLRSAQPTGPTSQALFRREVLREYLNEVANNPGDILEERGIQVAPGALKDNVYFTDEQKDEIFSALTFHYDNYDARCHDADITTLIMRRRKGHVNADIFKSKYLLMTRNGRFAQVVREKCIELGALSNSSTPPVVHRKVIAASIWLRTGLVGKDYEVPKRLLLANCERVLAVRPRVVEKVKEYVQALGDENKKEQLNILVSMPRSAQMLMDKTLGAPSVVNEENVEELFEEMLHPYLEEERKKGEAAVIEEQNRANSEIEKKNIELEQVRDTKSEFEAKLEAVYREDKIAVESLCKFAENKLRIRRNRRRFKVLIWSAIILAATSIVPFILSTQLAPTAWNSKFSALFLIFGLPLGFSLIYLTITGSKWVRIPTTEEEATQILFEIADERGLSEKMRNFEIDWHYDHFQINELLQRN